MNDTANMAIEAEQLVIGSLLQKPELLSAIDLGPEHFSSSVYEQAYRACEDLRMAGTPIDMISVWSWLADKHPSDEWGQRLGRAIEAAYAPDNIELYADRDQSPKAVNTLAVAWRYRIADNYAAGPLINKAGPIDRASVEVILRERFGREAMELEPCA